MLIPNLLLELSNFFLDACLIGLGGVGQVASGVFQPLVHRMQDAFRGRAPANMLAQPGQPRVKRLCKKDRYARLQLERQLSIGVDQQRNYRFLILEGTNPFLLARAVRVGINAVLRHQIQHAPTVLEGLYYLLIAVDSGLQLTLVDPNGYAWGSGNKLVSQFERQILAISARIADEKEGFCHWLVPVYSCLSGMAFHVMAGRCAFPAH